MTFREKVAQARARQKKALKKAAICAALVGIAGISIGMASRPAEDVQQVEVTYTVKPGDTFWDISETFLKKNTGGRRYILEFQEGIKELNPWLLDTKGQVQPGDVLRINYWVKN